MSAALAVPSAGAGWLKALPRPSPAFGYTLRVLAAIALALYAAYALELETPWSAGTTVIVLMNASRGAILSKSLYRIVGSLVGAIAAVAIVATLVQAPVLFILATAAWVGACTFIGSLLRYNRSYGAVLAGYTVTLIALGAVGAPERIFDIATARLAVVVIGVLATALVFFVTDIGPGRGALEAGVTKLAARAAAILAAVSRSGDAGASIDARHALGAQMSAFDQTVEFASAEDAGLARYKGDLRLAIAELFAALIGGFHAVTLTRALPREQRALVDGALARLAALAPPMRAADERAQLGDSIAALRAAARDVRDVKILAALAQGIALLSQFDAALAGLEALQEGVRLKSPYGVRFYVNPVTAARNGLRAGIAVAIAGILWIVSRWPDGGSMLALMGPICALISQTESAARSSVQFMWGTLLAGVAALACSYVLLPQASGFPLLIACLSPFLVAGILLSRSPRFGMIGVGYLVTFMTLVAPGNPMRFDLGASLNSAVAFAISGACAALAFRVLLPPDPAAEARVLTHSIRNAVQRLASARRVPPLLVWEHLQHQKMVRLSNRLASFPAERQAALTGAADAIMVGRHLIALRAPDAELPARAQDAASRVLAACRRLLSDPDGVAATAQAESAALLQEGETPPAVLRLAGELDDLGALVAAHRDFFARRAP